MKWTALVLVMAGAFPLFGAGKAAKERSVTLDVKNLETRAILKSVQKQCGIKNVVIDPNVPDTPGTFLMKNVPCRTALPVILHSLGLEAVNESSALVTVGVPKG